MTPMVGTASALERLDRDFLEMRAKILEVASSLDRIERGADPAAAAADPRIDRLRTAAAVLFDGQAERASRVQKVFSDAYDPVWRKH